MEQIRQPHLKPILTTLVNMPPDRLHALSIKEIADASYLSRRAVQYKLKILRNLGAIEAKRTRDGRGNKYQFVLHPMVYSVVRSNK